MADYNETTVTGSAWQRCCQVVVDNRRGVTPSIRFDEERLTALSDGDTVRRALGALTVPYDATAVVELRDPNTGETTGETITHAEIYAILYSAYLGAALARDAAANPPEQETV